MEHCCTGKTEALALLRVRQRRVLQLVLAVNAVMFTAEFVAGLVANSTALLADSLDMLGDALVYGLSLYSLHRSEGWRASAAFVKGVIMALFGAGVLVKAVLNMLSGVVPQEGLMGMFGMLALGANVGCLLVLLRHQDDDLNMRSAWLCSRNDVIANAGVLLAAAGVFITGTAWPDLLIGLAIASLFLHSAHDVVRTSVAELRLAFLKTPVSAGRREA
jgi:cation diffusion facilitator family transporter